MTELKAQPKVRTLINARSEEKKKREERYHKITYLHDRNTRARAVVPEAKAIMDIEGAKKSVRYLA